MSEVRRNSIDSIYCLKALCAFFVVVLHSMMWGKWHLYFLLKTAVPCFYAISGYFLFADDVSVECAKAWKWIKKTALLYAFLCIVYLSYKWTMYGKIFDFETLFACLVTGGDASVHLWYLNSMWQGLLVFIVLRRCRCWHPLSVILLLVLGAAGSVWILPYCYPHSWQWACVSPFWALALMSSGYYVRKYRLNRIRTSIVAFFLMLCLLVAYFFVKPHGFCDTLISRFCYMATAMGALVLCVKYSHWRIPFIAWIGKYHSANIYYYHVIVLELMVLFSEKYFGVEIRKFSPPLTYSMTLFLSVLLSRMEAQGKRLFSLRSD